MLAATTTADAWTSSLSLFLVVALKVMGYWAFIEVNALLLGFLLQPNFTGLLTRTNPSELWWAWRGTFTNWLVRYVYGPLGANRRHRAVNVVAAFGVSWLWHVLGVAFFAHNARPALVYPITFWATLNATVMIGWLEWRARGWRVLPARPPSHRRATKILLTCCSRVQRRPLHFQGEHIDRFGHYLGLLAGVGG